MGSSSIIGLIVLSVLGIAMASIGIEFYKKNEKRQSLSKKNYDWLQYMLVAFCIIVIVSFIVLYRKWNAT